MDYVRGALQAITAVVGVALVMAAIMTLLEGDNSLLWENAPPSLGVRLAGAAVAGGFAVVLFLSSYRFSRPPAKPAHALAPGSGVPESSSEAALDVAGVTVGLLLIMGAVVSFASYCQGSKDNASVFVSAALAVSGAAVIVLRIMSKRTRS